MLTHLKIENIAVIEKADIDFTLGLNVLTGETGAGKSIIIDSINAILGERTSKELIRSGAEKAKVVAEFDEISANVIEKLAEYEIDYDDSEPLIIMRTISSDGRSGCRINGQAVNVSTLKEIGAELITICGQHDSQKLLQKSSHLAYIDTLANASEKLSEYRISYRKLKKVEKELSEISTDEAQKQQQLEFLDYQIKEIDSANIVEGEKEELLAQKKRIQNREKLILALHGVRDLIEGNESSPGIADLIYELVNQLGQLDDCGGTFGKYRELCENLKYELEECASDASGELMSLEEDSMPLDDIEFRLDTIYRLSRKYGETESDILATLDNLREQYSSIQRSDEKIAELKNEIEYLNEDVFEKAVELTKIRQKAAETFADNVRAELQYLDMSGADFQVSFEETKPTLDGIDNIEFVISPNPGQELKPLSKIASGGELSRVMLAIRCVLSKAEIIDTMIFDEIDTGVSGKASGKIAIKLRQLSKSKQVICITHLPQIAASATTHLYIEKEINDNNTLTHVSTLDYDRRVEEIARIISGDAVTATTLESAKEMIKFNKN